VQGYFNTWPAIVRKEWEVPADETVYRPFPPSPEAIDRMLETMRWVQWLEVEQRHRVDAGQALRLARHHDPLCLRPHDGVAALAAGIADVADQLNGVVTAYDWRDLARLVLMRGVGGVERF
jgi:hypothetical protein